MNTKAMLGVIGAVAIVVVLATVLNAPDTDAPSCGTDGNKVWFFTVDGTYVEYWGNISDKNWSVITSDRDHMEAYYEMEKSRIGDNNE